MSATLHLSRLNEGIVLFEIESPPTNGTLARVRGSGGMMIVPQFTIANAPAPDVIVVPHFDHPAPSSTEMSAIHHWIKDAHKHAALTMSVCTGAFQLAKTGLLDSVEYAGTGWRVWRRVPTSAAVTLPSKFGR